MSAKKFRLAAEQIRPIATGYGSCIASDRITVDGLKVGYCCRESADDQWDSGWRFFAGDESEDYANQSANFEVYNVNTIANYDPGIAVLLDAPEGLAFERTPDDKWLPVSEPSG